MSLIPSLLRVIVLLDGDALVLHVGDRPYVLTGAGQIDLEARVLTYVAVSGIITELLPADSQRALQELGTAQHELDLPELPGEREINIVHERESSLISQREAHGGPNEMIEVARAASREDPDVLVLETVRAPGLMTLALDAAASGRLVICGFPAHGVTGAVDGIIDLFPPEARPQVQLSLAQTLRGVVVQVLLNRIGGGRLAAREVLFNTSAAASVIAEGKTSQLPLVIEAGRKLGMVPLNDALAGFVQSGLVDLREGFQHAHDKAGFLATLQRQGFDTTSVERFA